MFLDPGEYLLMSLPTIATQGIGDTDSLLQTHPQVHLYNHNNPNRVKQAVKWIEALEPSRKRAAGLEATFSLGTSISQYAKALGVSLLV
ncbi:hypothetical protein [Litoribacter populi]|uniref:hypothetical protein n=1 Tax=Litoribacter populi TaxID=2598460 RepID=UPI00117DC068|nr:hypothetical protein [Litoribacter populi]